MPFCGSSLGRGVPWCREEQRGRQRGSSEACCGAVGNVNYPPLTQGASCFIPLPIGSGSTGSTALIRRLQVRIV